MIRKYFRLRRRLVVGLALAALTAVPVAQATTNRSAPHDPALESALTSNGSQGIEVVSENGQTQATAPRSGSEPYSCSWPRWSSAGGHGRGSIRPASRAPRSSIRTDEEAGPVGPLLHVLTAAGELGS